MHSSPCGEVYWNSNDSEVEKGGNIPPRAGRCIEISMASSAIAELDSSPCGEVYWNLQNGSLNLTYTIPPRAGRCIEIGLNLFILLKKLFLPVRGGVLKFWFRQLCRMLPIPPRAGRCIEIYPRWFRFLQVNSSPCGEVYWNLIFLSCSTMMSWFLPVRGGVLKLTVPRN